MDALSGIDVMCANLGVDPVAHISDGNLVYPEPEDFEVAFPLQVEHHGLIEDVTQFKAILDGSRGHSYTCGDRNALGLAILALTTGERCCQWRHQCSAATGGMGRPCCTSPADQLRCGSIGSALYPSVGNGCVFKDQVGLYWLPLPCCCCMHRCAPMVQPRVSTEDELSALGIQLHPCPFFTTHTLLYMLNAGAAALNMSLNFAV